MSFRIALSAYLISSLVSCGAPNKDEGHKASGSNVVEESLLHSLTRASSPSEALRLLPVSVGDKVRIVPSPITDEQGISGMIGEVIGVTDSASGATIYIKELGQEFGMSADLLELVDLPVGTDISMGDRTWISNQDGEWIEVEIDR